MKRDMAPDERSSNTTFNMIYLVQALKHYSESNPVTLKELSKKCDFCSIYTLRNLLDALYRKTNPKNKHMDFRLIKYVKDKSVDKYIEWNDDNINGGETFYYKIEFDLKKSEIKLLTDALSMFPFLDAEQTIKLIRTVEQVCSVPDIYSFREIMNEYDYKVSSNKNHLNSYSSNEFFKTIELITEAMKIGKCVKFNYYMYSSNPEKTKLVFGKRSEKIFHPGFFMWANGFYYLVGKDNNMLDKDFTNLRVDRIQEVEICKNLQICNMEYVNPAKYRDENPVMYGGEAVTVEFRVREFLLNAVVDSFGRNLQIRPTDFTDLSDNEYVIIKTSSSIDGAAMWLTEYCNFATALSPLSLVEKVKDTLLQGLNLYDAK